MKCSQKLLDFHPKFLVQNVEFLVCIHKPFYACLGSLLNFLVMEVKIFHRILVITKQIKCL